MSRAKKVGVAFEIDTQWVIDHMPIQCPCCQKPFRQGDSTGRGQKAKDRPSLDRIVPELGYTKENTRIICTWCNIIKNDGTEKNHRMIAQWLANGAPQYCNNSMIGIYGDGI
jgi:hypothetical protein